jgi:hypothetical protein
MNNKNTILINVNKNKDKIKKSIKKIFNNENIYFSNESIYIHNNNKPTINHSTGNKIKIIQGIKYNNINNVILNKFYQRNILTQTFPKNNIYNIMVQKSINDIQIFLNENELFYDEKIKLIEEKCNNSIMYKSLNSFPKNNENMIKSLSYKKIYYILFWYLGITRGLINVLQNDIEIYMYFKKFFWENTYIKEKIYGLCILFNNNIISIMNHPLSMKRFDNYKLRFLYNYYKYIVDDIEKKNNSLVKINYTKISSDIDFIHVIIKNSLEIAVTKSFGIFKENGIIKIGSNMFSTNYNFYGI